MSALVYPELALHEAGAAISIGGSVLLLCVAAALAGRAFLSWFPAGSIGGHGPRELPVTWAASHLVGLAWLLAVREVVPEGAWLGVALGTAALAGVARLVTLPAGLVPRHEPVTSAAWPASLIVLVLLTVAGAYALAAPSARPDPLALASAAATLVLFLHGLHLARSPVGIRVFLCTAIAPFFVLTGGPAARAEFVPPWLAAAAFAAGTVGWLRRGDRRALTVAAVGVALVAAHPVSGIVAAACLVAVLVLATAKPSRLRALAWCGVAALAGEALRDLPVTSDSRDSPGPLGDPGTYELACAIVPWLLMVTAGFLFALLLGAVERKAPRAAWNPSGAPRGRERRALVLAALLLAAPVAIGLTTSYDVELGRLASWPMFESWILIAFATGLQLTEWHAQGSEAA